MKHIKEAEGIHKTQSPFFSWPPNSLWGKGRRRKREGGLRFTLIQAVMASPAQLHLGSRPAREGCLLACHRPPPDESGGSQTFTPLERLRPRPCRRHNGRSVLRASSSPQRGCARAQLSREPRRPEASGRKDGGGTDFKAKQSTKPGFFPVFSADAAPPKQLQRPLTSGSHRR